MKEVIKILEGKKRDLSTSIAIHLTTPAIDFQNEEKEKRINIIRDIEKAIKTLEKYKETL